MDSLNVPAVVWSFFVVLPVILATALCIRCRRRIPNRIPQYVEYNKPTFTLPPSSSFVVMSSSSGSYYPPRTPISPSITSQYNPFLTIPSPALSQRRTSSVGANMSESILGIRAGSDKRMLTVDKSWMNKSSDEDYEEEDDGSYTNETIPGDYIEVIPDKSDPQDETTTGNTPTDNRTSMSSGSNDNYVNVGDQSDVEDTTQCEGAEYVNVEDAPKQSDDVSEDENDYENVESRKDLSPGRHSSC